MLLLERDLLEPPGQDERPVHDLLQVLECRQPHAIIDAILDDAYQHLHPLLGRPPPLLNRQGQGLGGEEVE